MLATFILRLVPAALRQGDVVGRVECVETGEGCTCKHLDDLIEFLRAQTGSPATTEEGNE